MTKDNIFYIEEIPVIISSVTPLAVKPIYQKFTNYVETVQITYNIKYQDIHFKSSKAGYSDINLEEILTTEVTEDAFPTFIEYENLTKKDFYPLAIKIANSSVKMLKTIKQVRIRSGLDADVPLSFSNLTVNSNPLPFQD